MPKIVVVPHSAIVVRRPEKADLPPPLRTRFGKRGVDSASDPTKSQITNESLFRSSTLRRFLRRGSTSVTGKDEHTDHIFRLHAERQRKELHRRKTEESLHRKAKTSISRPFISPPAPDRDILKKYGERQDRWNRRSTALKSKKEKPSNTKRFSLRTWKIESGRRDTTGLKMPQQSHVDAEAKHTPPSLAKRVQSFSSLTFSSRPAQETLPVRGDRQRHARAPTPVSKHSRAASDTHLSTRHNHFVPPREPKKASSMRALRPQVSYNDHLPVSARQHLDQRRAHPVLRPQHSIDKSRIVPSRQPRGPGLDQGNIHPALHQPNIKRNIPVPTRQDFQQPLDEAHIHPALHQPNIKTNLPVPTRQDFQQPLDEAHIHPALRSNAIILPSRLQNRPLPPAQKPQQPVPRVRIIPPSTFIQPHNFTTKHTILPIKPPTNQERITLTKSLNSMRASVSVGPLDLHPLLSNHAQDHAALFLAPLPPPKPLPPIQTPRRASARSQSKHRATSIEDVEFKAARSASAIRLISPPGLGALACGELWAGGKYKRHKTVKHGQVPSEHRFTLLPGFHLDDRESVATNGSSNGGASWCSCAEWDAYKAVVDGRWKCCGIGRAEDGRWVVELWAPEGGALLK